MSRLATVIFCIATLLASSAVATQRTIGWIEPVLLLPDGLWFRAKIDTGAEHSSINTPQITLLTREGVEYARFTVRGRRGKVAEIERPVHRTATIRRHFGRRQARPVVLLTFCLGNLRKQVEVNLVDRSGFDYQLLLGRSFLAPDLVVDVMRELTTQPACGSTQAP